MSCPGVHSHRGIIPPWRRFNVRVGLVAGKEDIMAMAKGLEGNIQLHRMV
jgi:hypothetical protein